MAAPDIFNQSFSNTRAQRCSPASQAETYSSPNKHCNALESERYAASCAIGQAVAMASIVELRLARSAGNKSEAAAIWPASIYARASCSDAAGARTQSWTRVAATIRAANCAASQMTNANPGKRWFCCDEGIGS